MKALNHAEDTGHQVLLNKVGVSHLLWQLRSP
jgi:hypothetical protein